MTNANVINSMRDGQRGGQNDKETQLDRVFERASLRTRWRGQIETLLGFTAWGAVVLGAVSFFWCCLSQLRRVGHRARNRFFASEFEAAKESQESKARPFILSIGNFQVGGTGKTPFIIAFAEALTQKGLRVGVISRGYGQPLQSHQGEQKPLSSRYLGILNHLLPAVLRLKGRAASAAVIIWKSRKFVNGGEVSFQGLSDETLLLAKALPQVVLGVGANRALVLKHMLSFIGDPASLAHGKAQTRSKSALDVVILDDGFGCNLAQDFSLMLLKPPQGISGRLFKHSLSEARFAQAIVLTKQTEGSFLEKARWVQKPVKQFQLSLWQANFTAILPPQILAQIAGGSQPGGSSEHPDPLVIWVVCALADPQNFVESIIRAFSSQGCGVTQKEQVSLLRARKINQPQTVVSGVEQVRVRPRIRIEETLFLQDHASYEKDFVQALCEKAQRCSAWILISHKDAVKWHGFENHARVCVVDLSFSLGRSGVDQTEQGLPVEQSALFSDCLTRIRAKCKQG